MRGRSILLIVGGVLLLALLVGMKLWLVDDARRHEPPIVPITAQDQPLAPPVVTMPTREARIPPPRLVRPQPSELPAVGSAVVPVVVEAPSQPMAAVADQPRSTTPIADKATLRDQMNAVEPQVRACLDQFGGTATGTALLTWTVVPKGTEATTESSGVDYDETTVSDERLLTCLHETAKAMKFAGVPGALAVLGRRKLTIENGKLVSQKFISFSRIY